MHEIIQLPADGPPESYILVIDENFVDGAFDMEAKELVEQRFEMGWFEELRFLPRAVRWANDGLYRRGQGL